MLGQDGRVTPGSPASVLGEGLAELGCGLAPGAAYTPAPSRSQPSPPPTSARTPLRCPCLCSAVGAAPLLWAKSFLLGSPHAPDTGQPCPSSIPWGPASAHIPGHHPSPTLTTLGANTALACAATGGCPPPWVLNWTPQRADLGVTVEPAGLSASLLAGPSEQWHQPQQRGDAWSLAMSANKHTHTPSAVLVLAGVCLPRRGERELGFLRSVDSVSVHLCNLTGTQLPGKVMPEVGAGLCL